MIFYGFHVRHFLFRLLEYKRRKGNSSQRATKNKTMDGLSFGKSDIKKNKKAELT